MAITNQITTVTQNRRMAYDKSDGVWQIRWRMTNRMAMTNQMAIVTQNRRMDRVHHPWYVFLPNSGPVGCGCIPSTWSWSECLLFLTCSATHFRPSSAKRMLDAVGFSGRFKFETPYHIQSRWNSSLGGFKWNPDHEEELRSAFSFVKTKNKLLRPIYLHLMWYCFLLVTVLW